MRKRPSLDDRVRGIVQDSVEDASKQGLGNASVPKPRLATAIDDDVLRPARATVRGGGTQSFAQNVLDVAAEIFTLFVQGPADELQTLEETRSLSSTLRELLVLLHVGFDHLELTEESEADLRRVDRRSRVSRAVENLASGARPSAIRASGLRQR